MGLQGVKLLLVDDEGDFLHSLAGRLSLRGLAVTTAESGAQALQAMDREPAQVVVLDVWMPEMNGLEVLARIKKGHPQTQVILLTGHADLEASLEGMARGAYDYLTKPVKIDALLEKIAQALAAGSRPPARERDETFQVKMERRLRAADRLASLGTMAAELAHEINNPLAVINEAAGYLSDRLASRDDMDPKLRQGCVMALDKIEKSVQRIRRLSGGMLGFARQADDQPQEIDLAELAQEVVSLTAKTAQGVGAWLGVIHSPQPVTLWGDPYALRQVLLNLVSNALQAVDQGGRVEMRPGQDQDQVWLEVADDGRGIPAQDLERVFEPFFTTKPSGQGTGLGLSVSRGIVEKMGGRIELRSQPGLGSTFKVILPRVASPPAQSASPA